ncbi:hypothetical protein QN277_015052 [Acacia crassicarpa]|uniref:Amino acid transporter transmembrane domain-containing protein n=1 Tax=Acacia crassicarpa TaxID=499986 RepID=A0AAE1MTR7_9FABA|nr:hypothetical protein QN277_015052 [Acacia crassicarpa]
MEVESGAPHYFPHDDAQQVDDDGRPSRTGTQWTATAHIITAVVGAGVLSLAWAMAQLGWLIGLTAIFSFAGVTLYAANLLTDCYRSPDPVTGKRNYSYMATVKNILGGKQYIFCGIVQYGNLAAFAIGYTITTSISVLSIRKINCYHYKIEGESCRYSNNPYMIGFGIVEIVLSQIPNFHKLSWLSVIAAITSIGYASIGAGLSLATIIQGKGGKTSFTGSNPDQTPADRAWNMLVALGNMALASTYSQLIIDIEDTLKSSPPENETMKKANRNGIVAMTIMFLLCSCSGYAAFGPQTPGSILMASGFHEPFWLVDLANVLIVVHLVGAYQVITQPIFRMVETMAGQKWPNTAFVTKEYRVGIGKMKLSVNMLRLVWRTIFVAVVTVLGMAMPFFNDMLALLGAIGFWPSVVYFPVQMTIATQKIQKRSLKWFGLQTLNFFCFLVSLAAACAAIHGINQAMGRFKPFMYKD